MSQQLLQPRGVQSAVSTTRPEGTMEDNFAAMRHAAMSMFKQRTKDLTMVSSMTTEAQEAEELNTQLQSTINQLQEQRAVLEAQIETEERRVKEREQHLREVHAMLAQMKEDQSVFSGVQRASEKIAGALRHFVMQYTAKDGDIARLLERSHERAQGRGSSEWRAAANDLRRRQAILEDHIRLIERDHTVPQGFGDLLLEWSRGVWRQHVEYAPVLRVCEQMLQNDAAGAVQKLLPSPVRCENATERDVKFLLELDVHVDACVGELDALAEIGTLMEKESESVGLCCSVVPRKRVDSIRTQWLTHRESRTSLMEVTTTAKELSRQLKEECAAVELVSGRLATLDAQISDVERDVQQEWDMSQREVNVRNSLLLSWNKALQAAVFHKGQELTYQSMLSVNEREAVQLEVDLVAKVTVMEARWMALLSNASQLQNTLHLEEQHRMEVLRELQSARGEHKEAEVRLSSLRDDCASLEGELRRECEEAARSPLSEAAGLPQAEGVDGEEEDAARYAAVHDVLQQLLQCGEAQENGEDNTDALDTLLSQTGLEADLLHRAARCVAALRQETRRVLDDHQRWMQSADEELAVLAAE